MKAWPILYLMGVEMSMNVNLICHPGSTEIKRLQHGYLDGYLIRRWIVSKRRTREKGTNYKEWVQRMVGEPLS
jgi:hypothetical protein